MHRHIPKAEKEIALRMSLDSGLSNTEIAKYTGICPRTMRALLKQYKETGEVVKKPVVSGRPRLLNSLDATFTEGLVERQPDILLSEIGEYLRHICHIDASSATITRTLHRQGFTRKKVTRPAIEQNERDHADFKMLVGEYFRPEHLVFADESHFNRLSLQRNYAWAPRGDHARRRDFFVRGKQYSILPAISLDGVIHLEVIDHAFTGHEFANFVRGVLDQMQPWPLPNSVLVMDNAQIHKVAGIQEMVEERGMRLLFLPAYSPDLNPIKEAFSCVKSWLRTNRVYVLGETEGRDCDPYALIWEAVYTTVTPEKIYGWYKHSEYIA